MADWPRTIDPTEVTRIETFPAERTATQGGPIQRRAPIQRGRMWEETYPWLKSGRASDETLLATIELYWQQGTKFQIDHPLLPGSGKAPQGAGTSGVTVSGADQTGNTVDTTGWPLNTSDVVVAGDVIKLAGVDYLLRVTANADSDNSGNATIDINPPIYSGHEPTDGGAVTTTDAKMDAMVWGVDGGRSAGADYYAGVTVTFREIV